MKTRLVTYLAISLSVIGLGIATVIPNRVSATPSSVCWAYAGGDRSVGGCKGNPHEGTTFQVVQWCGWMNIKTYSPETYTPPGVAKNATTKPCPKYSPGVRQAQIYSW